MPSCAKVPSLGKEHGNYGNSQIYFLKILNLTKICATCIWKKLNRCHELSCGSNKGDEHRSNPNFVNSWHSISASSWGEVILWRFPKIGIFRVFPNHPCQEGFPWDHPAIGVSLWLRKPPDLPSGYLTQPWKIPFKLRFLAVKIIYFYGPSNYHGYVSLDQGLAYCCPKNSQFAAHVTRYLEGFASTEQQHRRSHQKGHLLTTRKIPEIPWNSWVSHSFSFS